MDIKPLERWYQLHEEAENIEANLRRTKPCLAVTEGWRSSPTSHTDMGGMGFIELNKAACMLSVLINTHARGRPAV